MANIMDYIDWRGDITFSQSSFNEVDNLIFAQLSYVDFGDIVPSCNSNDFITVEDASNKFFSMYSEKEILKQVSFTRMSPFLLKKMASSKRYRDVKLSKYVNRVDKKLETQFSAIVISLDKDTVYVAYRGTDNTIVGWKEDFNMSFMDVVPAQIEAVDYLNGVITNNNKKVILGGHSKGGNLAMYAGSKCNGNIKERIVEIYNNDGPGFNSVVVSSDDYKSVLHLVKTIIPQSSIFGMLLDHKDDYTVVKSTENGLMQHDAFSWEVIGTHFIYVEDVSSDSSFINSTVRDWLEMVDPKERERFINSLFNVLEECGIHTTKDFTVNKMDNVVFALKSMKDMSPETKEVLSKTVRILYDQCSHKLKKSLKSGEKRFKGLFIRGNEA